MPQFLSKVEIDVPRDYAFQWHQSAYAFERLAPPWETIVVESKQGSIDTGSVTLKNRVGPFWIRMKAQHSNFWQDEQFYDEMSGGPFQRWQHWHRFESQADQTELTDEIHYRLKGFGLGQLVAGGKVRRSLEQMFAYRHQVTKTDIQDHYRYRQQGPKTIAVTGASGLVGQALCEYLAGGGHQIIRLERSSSVETADSPCWNPETGQVNFGPEISSVNCLVHLAGYGIASRRWNPKVKAKIQDSRLGPTEKLSQYLAQHNLVSESMICASATGFYGDRGDEVLDENAPAGNGFLAETCVPWEQACQPAANIGIRTVNARFGMILSAKAGALQKMLLPFRLGIGGSVGGGNQYWSWISLYDTIRAIYCSIMNENVRGPVNFTAPKPVKQRQFAKVLGTVLFRPTFLPMPAFAAKLALGEMAKYLLLDGNCVIPQKLTNCGFEFVHNNLEEALRFELGRFKINRNST